MTDYEMALHALDQAQDQLAALQEAYWAAQDAVTKLIEENDELYEKILTLAYQPEAEEIA